MGSISSFDQNEGRWKRERILVEGSQVPSCMGIVTNVASMAIERKTAGARTNQGGKGGSCSHLPDRPGNSPKKEKFAGKRNNCGKPGHKKAECWAITGKGKGKSGGNQKPKPVASVESHPEPEPAAASGLELCSLEVDTLTVVDRGEDAQEGVRRRTSR